MSMPARRVDLIALSDYLAMDEASKDARLEYTAGHVYALAGASRRHVAITRNLTSLLQAVLEERGCNAFASDLRVRVSADLYYYPDVIVACGPREDTDRDETAPSLLAEVLSESTEERDLGIKLAAYRSLPSLLAYLIVSQEERRVELHWRMRFDAPWAHEVSEGGATLRLAVLGGFDIPLDAVYRGAGV